MKKLFLLALVVLSHKSLAYDFAYEDLYYNIINDSSSLYEVEVTRPADTLSYEQALVTIPSIVHHKGKDFRVTSIGMHAFSFSENLEEVIIPNTVTNIDTMSFMFCNSLRHITIPNSVKKIGFLALWSKSLEYVFIGTGVEEIETNFNQNPSLRSITIEAINPPVYEYPDFYLLDEMCSTIYVPKKSLYKYANAKGWGNFGRILPIGGDTTGGIFKPDYDPKNAVKGVAGCDFGCSEEYAVDFFNNKFKHYASRNSYEAKYTDVYFAGCDFDIMCLQFAHNKQTDRKEFCSIEFQKMFELYDTYDAKNFLESVRYMYSKKYSNERESKSEEGLYVYGMINEDYDKTYPPITLRFIKGLGKDGKERYYIILSYYAFNAGESLLDDI